MLAARLAEILEVLRSRAHLALAGARGDDHEITHLAAAANFEEHDIGALRVCERARHIDRELARRLWISSAAGSHWMA
jgi:hypothetical protein